jgi:Flp pilus assembly protein TadG
MSRIRRGRGHRGQTLVEFALILPIFILLLMGIFDLGRAVYAYNTISNAAREAVRVAIVDQACSTVGAEADARAASLDVNWDSDALDPCSDVDGEIDINYLDASLDGTECAAPIAMGCYAEVTVRYEFTAATPIIGNLLGTLHMEATTRQGVEFTNPDF